METGRTVILLNLEHLYASLYDVLNQYYMYYSGTRYVDLGLQTNKVKCRVHQDFKWVFCRPTNQYCFSYLSWHRLILIAEKDTVYKSFPTPLINRLEKHFVLTSTILEEWQCKVLEEFNHWIKHFSQTRYFTLLQSLHRKNFSIFYAVIPVVISLKRPMHLLAIRKTPQQLWFSRLLSNYRK